MKKLFSISLAIIMLVFCALQITASAAEAASVCRVDVDTRLSAYDGTSDLPVLLTADDTVGKALNDIPDDGEIKEDGINTYVATVWIVSLCSVFAAAILTLVIILAKKNNSHR